MLLTQRRWLAMPSLPEVVLDIRNLSVRLGGSSTPVVDSLSLSVNRGEVLGVAGESGSGKTMTALSLLGLLPAGARAEGSAEFEGKNLISLRPRDMWQLRGRKIAMIFQDPLTALHPMLTVERQLTEHVRYHLRLGREEARDRALALLEEVRIPNQKAALKSFPYQFSGGMRQRIQIAMALACEPALVIADEPTTALDVTVQAGILRLLARLRESRGLSVILITHDLGVLAALADKVAVMYAGRVVEYGPAEDVIIHPRHPYTSGLLESLPTPGGINARLTPIPGTPPSALERPEGCAFHPRCRYAEEKCRAEVPALTPTYNERGVSEEADRLIACPVDPFARVLASSER
jgi:oligopeptide transport system ATP-binding protein